MRRSPSAVLSQSHPSPVIDWLTTPEVAALLRVHPKHVYRLLAQGMPARRLGGQWRYCRQDIEDWSARRARGAHRSLRTPHTTAAAPAASIVALAPGEIPELVATFLGEATRAEIAMLHAVPSRAVDLLVGGQVVAALLSRSTLPSLPCSTVRVTVGTRAIGLLSKLGLKAGSDALPRNVRSIAVPSTIDRCSDLIQPWLGRTQARGVKVHDVASEQEACFALMSGRVDAAVGPQHWAARLGLAFLQVARDDWDLVVRVDAMANPNVSQLCVTVQSQALRARVRSLLGGSVAHVGTMVLVPARTQEPAGRLSAAAPCPSANILPSPRASARRRSRCATRWATVTRERPDQVLSMVRHLQQRGLSVGGFVQVPSGPASEKPLGYDLYRVAHAERVPFAERTASPREQPSNRFCELLLHTESLARAWQWLREDMACCDVLVVDGVGRLEEQGQGLFPALAWARSIDGPKLVLLSVRSGQVPNIADPLFLSDRMITGFALGAGSTSLLQAVERIASVCGRRKTGRRTDRSGRPA
jgi:putative molybdopterin biosynthesis protein